MQRFAVVDTETTGFGKTDRVIEIAIILIDGKEIIQEWETLINPERDISNSEIHGITSNLVSLAPTFEEVCEDIASLLDDRVFVAHNLPFDKRIIEQEFSKINKSIDFGNGFCTLQATQMKLEIACKEYGFENVSAHRALTDARATAFILLKIIEEAKNSSKELSPISVKSNKLGQVTRTFSRSATSEEHKPGQQNLRRIFRSINISGNSGVELSYLDGISSVMSDFEITPDEKKHLDDWAKVLGISAKTQSDLHTKFLNEIINSAKRDNYISELEEELITKASSALGIKVNKVSEKEVQNNKTQLKPAMRICFTGKATDSNGNEILRETLESYAKKAGYTPVLNVTKKDCDLVVAEDKSSMSGKTKKARNFNIPVMSVQEFLDTL